MNRFRVPVLSFLFSVCQLSLVAQSQPAKTQIMLLGSAHFGQTGFYKNAPLADLFHERRQRELSQLRSDLARFKPDVIFIEREPREQADVDSVYKRYKAGELQLTDLPYGRSESHQLAYALGRELGHPRVYGIDYYSGSSNRMLKKGERVDYYLNEMNAFASLGNEVTGLFQSGKTTVSEYLLTLNSPDVLQKTYHSLFVAPAKVRKGFLDTTDPMLDSSRISYDYVGADFISHFYNRELRIYANIVGLQLTQKNQRILVIMGQRHAAALTRILADDPDYAVIPVASYVGQALQKKKPARTATRISPGR
ncbi:DUF5694 domain-containing protein [Spirosoma rigui]|uniref:DUF5694 domain-containing protein n=1 Tax=Spirosoma rigui TaxID=564064 RepID=UPI0012D2FB7C|nr:DUF5694 domain-containing protein [Spirosoma rigui]